MHQRPGSVPGSQEIHNQVERLRMQDGGSLKIFSRGCRAGEYKNARPDDRSDAQRRQRPRAQRLTKPVLRVFRLRDQFVDGLAAEELAACLSGSCVVDGGLLCQRALVSFSWTGGRGRNDVTITQ